MNAENYDLTARQEAYYQSQLFLKKLMETVKIPKDKLQEMNRRNAESFGVSPSYIC